jgi:hypothetical protein
MLKNIFKSVWMNAPEEGALNKNVNFSATKFRNYFMGDPILDYLNRYGEKFGFQKDDKSENSYMEHILQRGQEFEKYIMDLLTPKFKKMNFVNIGNEYPEGFNDSGVHDTIRHMRNGTEVIYQGFLQDKELRIFGIPDLMIRADKLREIFDGFYPEFDAIEDTMDRKGKLVFPHLYVIVDIKISTLEFLKKGTISRNKLMKVYAAQLFVYNKILENLLFERTEIETPFFQPNVFLLSPRLKIGNSLILDGKQNIARINLNNDMNVESSKRKKKPEEETEEKTEEETEEEIEEKNFAVKMRKALNWLKEMYANGESWNLLMPSRKELCPNMKNKEDYPWHNVKSVLAKQQGSLSDRTGFSHEDSIAISEKKTSVEEHITKVKNSKKRRLMEVMNDVRTDDEANDAEIQMIQTHPAIIESPEKMNIYVDFEYISGCEFTFDPDYRTHLYLIGMGYELNGKFIYEHFMVDCLTQFEEKRIIKRWISRMQSLRQNRELQLIHWSKAEPEHFSKFKDILQIRGTLNWQDLMKLFENCPAFLKEHCGVLNNSKLKTVAKAMKKRGHIQSDWDDEMTSGMEANMVIIRGIRDKYVKFTEFPGIDRLIHYNKIDCATLYEIVKYVRSKKQSF